MYERKEEIPEERAETKYIKKERTKQTNNESTKQIHK